MRSAIVEMIDQLVEELANSRAFHCSYDQDPQQVHKEKYDSTINRLEEIRGLAEEPRNGVLDCTGDRVGSASSSKPEYSGGREGLAGSRDGAGEDGGDET